MKSHSTPNDMPPLFATAPAFAKAAMTAHMAEQRGFSGLWQRFGWWMSGAKILRDLPDITPAIGFGIAKPCPISPDRQLHPTLLIQCAPCPTPVTADEGMDFIKAYAVGCELVKPRPNDKAAPLWQRDVASKNLLVGAWTSVNEIEDPYCRPIIVCAENQVIADGNTDDLTWSVADLVAAASAIMPLPNGFVISCGMAVTTNNGKPITQSASETMSIEIEGLSPLKTG